MVYENHFNSNYDFSFKISSNKYWIVFYVEYYTFIYTIL